MYAIGKVESGKFLSSNAQDFIEDVMWVMVYPLRP